LIFQSKGIHHKVRETRVISSPRKQLKLNLQSWKVIETNLPTMPPMQSSSASRSLTRGLEGLSSPFLYDSDSTLIKDMMMTMDTTQAALTSNLEFNTGESTINTPDIAFEVFENIFNEPGTEIRTAEPNIFTEVTSPESDFFQNIEYEPTMQEKDMDTVETMDTTESIWGHGTFDFEENEFDLCAPASLVEGTFDQNESTFTVIEPTSGNDPLEIENVDLLQWIVEDQNINIQEGMNEVEEKKNFVKPEVERVSVIVPVQRQVPEESTPVVEIKIEHLTEDEKYRKMRDQNNEASKRCRANRKRKHQELEDELIELERKNVVLKEKMDSMEREVKLLKKKFLSDISLSSKILH